MSAQKSRQTRVKNNLSPEEFQKLLNTDEEDNDNRTAEEKEIDKKLSESGLDDVKGLLWHEKKAIYKTLNASVNTSEYEKKARNSPKVGGLKNSEERSSLQKPKERVIPIVVENSDGAISSDEEVNKDSNQSVSNTNVKKSSSINPFINAFQSIKNVFVKSDSSDIEKSETFEKTNSQKLFSDSENNDNHINSNKKSGIGAEDDKITIDISSDEDSEKIFHPNKKRPSPPETDRFDCIKRLKMDRPSITVSKISRTPLKTEIELAKKQHSVPFKRRSIRAILNELEMANKMYKEASVKYKFPVRWGTPIVKNSERWDSQNIPKKLVDRYQQYLTSNDLPHAAFIPTCESQTSAVVEPLLNYQLIEDEDEDDVFRENTKSRAKDVLNSDFERSERKTEMKAILDNVQQENVKNTPKQSSARKTRGRNQQKKIDPDYEPAIDDDNDNGDTESQEQDSGEWLPKNERKPKKNGKTSKHGKNFKIDLDRQPVVRVEKLDNKYKFFKSKNAEVQEKGSKSKMDDVIQVSQEAEQYTQEKEIQTASDSELVDCPICSKMFKKDLIENHAQECATKTFQD